MESHLLQMRGLKHRAFLIDHFLDESHLLQMRGLKLPIRINTRDRNSRIFYRCVD